MVDHMVHITSNTIGRVIADELERSDLSLRQISDRSLMPRTTLARKIEVGGFTFEELTRLANAFGTTVADLTRKAEAAA